MFSFKKIQFPKNLKKKVFRNKLQEEWIWATVSFLECFASVVNKINAKLNKD